MEDFTSRLELPEYGRKAAAHFWAEFGSAAATMAKSHDRTGAQLLRDFMRDYVAQRENGAGYEAWLTDKVEQSRTSADAGHLVPAADVEAKFAARRASARSRLARK